MGDLYLSKGRSGWGRRGNRWEVVGIGREKKGETVVGMQNLKN